MAAAHSTVKARSGRNPPLKTGVSKAANNACGQEAASTAVVLGHELAHAATGILDDGPGGMNTVNQYENPMRLQMGLPLRTAYPPIPPYSLIPPNPW